MALGKRVQDIVNESKNPLLGKGVHWERVPLELISIVLNGFAYKSSNFSKEKGVPLIRIRDVGKRTTDVLYDGPYDDMYFVEPGDIIIGMDGDFKSSEWLGERALLNQRVCKLKSISELYSKKFLKYVLPGYLNAINTETSSVTVKHLSSKSVCEIPLPLPPLPEQHRIVAKIEELLTKLDTGVEALKQVQFQLKRYRQSVLKAACNGLVGNVQDTTYFQKDNWKTIDLAIDNLNQGWSPKCERNPSGSPDIWGVIKTTAVQPMSFVDSENKKLPDHLLPRPTLEIQTEDVLVTRAGPRKRVGIACLVKAVRPHLMVCDKVYRIRCKDNKILPRYTELILNAPQVMDAINNLKTGISDSGVNLTQKRFLDLKIPLPPLSKQKIISDEVEHLFSIIEASEQIIESELRRAKSLRQSILKRAFEGKLVPQDPNDEPASVLLERIKAEKANSKKSKQMEMF